jgi:DNA-directed RNA polymerase specialized sigma54-like protein
VAIDDFLTILQLPILALREGIDQELEENPVLERQLAGDSVKGPVADPMALLRLPIEVLHDRVEKESTDIVVDRSEAGEPEVRIPAENWTDLIIDRRHLEMHQDPATAPSAREYLGRKIKRAHRLVEALERRRTTLLAVGVEIFRQQRAFLEQGPRHIVPLSLEEVARAIGAQVATVTHAVEQKRVWTPHGVFALGSFFFRLPKSSDN